MTVGDIVKTYRKEHDLSVREMAKLIGCHFSSLSRIENGITHPNMYTLRRISKVTGQDLDDLIDASLNLGIKPTEEELEVLHAYRHSEPIIQQAIKDILHINKAPSR